MSTSRQPSESMQQFRGRQKRELNAANDALNLKEGEPIQVGGRLVRFHARMIDRVRPSRMTRLEGDNLASFLTVESERAEKANRQAREQAEQDAFRTLPNVQDAYAIRWMIEDRLKEVIDRLAPEEWAEFRKKLEA